MEHKPGSPDKGTAFSVSATLQCGTKLLDLSAPVVMGILNVTPDSFYDGGNYKDADNLLRKAGKLVKEGAAIIDIGAVSTRPGAAEVSEDEEKSRLFPVIEALIEEFPDAIISVDTFRAGIARECSQMGAGIINDISGGQFDAGMFEMIGKQDAAYVLMHIKGKPETMQENPVYDYVTKEIYNYFSELLEKRGLSGKRNIILDPGFGFGKSVSDNYRLLNDLNIFRDFGYPVLAGISRKSMINKVLGTKPDQALNGTSVLNTIALLNGAGILRVHDVKEAMEAIKLVGALKQSGLNT
ncbi:MAG: dihydropteroate synthase [Bacteroidetes bacterium HGW-Bacteroidetes-9]|nr:MAG: dihydropteroate synthase [Bacteroidetes bacterium HGW-Bacteroidetes-9]